MNFQTIIFKDPVSRPGGLPEINAGEETADHEAQHAKLNYKMLVEDLGINEAEINLEAGGPIIFKDTAAILQSAIDGEHYETTTMYPEFAAAAQESWEDLLPVPTDQID